MIESEIDRLVQDFSYRLMYQGLKLEDYIKYMGQTMEQFRAQYKPQAAPRVLSQLVIDKIIRTEGFTAEDAEVEAKIAEQAASVEKTAEEYKKSMDPVSYTHLRAHETKANLVCRLLLEKNFFNDTATTEIYTYAIVGSVRCV